MTRPAWLAVATLAGSAALVLTGCTASGPTGASSAPIVDRTTATTTRTVAPPTASAATTVAPYPASGNAPTGEVAHACPYIRAGLDSEPTDGPNVADLEGDRVGRVTVLTGYRPVGCRFYFAYSYGDTQHEAVADILPFTYASAAAARNAMVRVATAGRDASTYRDFAPGLTGISYRTRFFGPDGVTDWAFAFTKGTRMVVVHTQQDKSANARNLAAAIAAKF